MMPAGPVRVAMLGFAHPLQQRLLASISRHPDVVLAAVWTAGGDAGEQVAATHRIPLESDLTVVLRQADIDAVVVGVPYPARARVIADALRCGKAVLCPQPVAVSLEEMKELEAALAETGALLLAPSEVRCRLPAARARQALHGRAVGRIYSLFCARRGCVSSGAEPSGVLLDLGTEALDYLSWCAMAPVVRVYAETATLFQPALAVEDTALVHLDFADGSMGLAEVAWSLPAGYPREADMEFEAVGEQGTVFVSPLNQKVVVHSRDGTTWEDWLTPASDVMAEALVRSLRHSEPPRQAIAEARQVLRLVCAAYESARTGDPVDLD